MGRGAEVKETHKTCVVGTKQFFGFFAFFRVFRIFRKILGKSLENLKRNLKKTFNKHFKPKNSYYLKWDRRGEKFCSQNEWRKFCSQNEWMGRGRNIFDILKIAFLFEAVPA